jgi:hypothetical protein
MANSFTDLANDAFRAADLVGRELVGAIPAVTVNTSAALSVAKGDYVRSHVTRSQTVNTSYAPAMTIPEGTDQTVDSKTMTINSYASVQIPYTKEDVKHLNNGAGWASVYGDQIKQAMRSITNKIEADLLLDIYKNAGNATGTSGTTPFASNFNVIADIWKLMADRGCPDDGLTSLVMDTAAAVKMMQLAALYQVNTSGSNELLRQGELLDLYGIKLRKSAQVALHTEGTNANYLTDLLAGYSVGDKTIHVDTGTGTLVAGDIVTFGGDTEKYVIGTGFAGDGDGDIVLNSGLTEAIADGEAVATENAYRANVAFHRDAVELCVRGVAGDDAAKERVTIYDPHSGLGFELRLYEGYQKMMIEIGCLYGYKVWKPDFVTILQG